MEKVLKSILRLKENNQKAIAILIDPDNLSRELLIQQVELAKINAIDFFFIGGSMITEDCLEETLDYIKSNCDIPTVIFPGSVHQVSNKADAILFLSLISGRNPDLLIGNHVLSAPTIKKSGIEVIPTGYLIIDGGSNSSVQFMSGSNPIPIEKPDILIAHSLAAQYLGKKLIYLESGSGAKKSIPNEIIKAVTNYINIPIIVGGGICSPKSDHDKVQAGASFIVIGSAIEAGGNQNIKEFADAIHRS